MPLKGTVGQKIKELVADNKKKGKARGQNGRIRSHKQIVAIALNSK